ncbi:ABC transporter ATP-binding protein [Thermovibrio sp.]
MPLEVKDLEIRTLGGVRLVKKVFWRVDKGKISAIVGESGSGKSISALTVLKLLPESLKVSGKVVVDGIEPLKLKGRELLSFRWKKVSFVFQDPNSAFNPLLKVGEQVIEPMVYHKEVPSKEEAVKRGIELLKLCQVPSPKERFFSYPHHLSGGLKQRCAIAMALSCSPDYLIADEPTTALDATVQKRILELLKELSLNGLGIALITHDIGVVEEVADRVFVIYAGYTVEWGSKEEVLGSPKHPYTKGLIECTPKLKGGKKGKLKAIPGSVPEPSVELKGCPFYPRCFKAKEICKEKFPPYTVSGGRGYACFFPEP